MMFTPVDERGVEAERDVVQEAPLARAADVHAPLLALESGERGERVVAVEPEVAREMVARAVGHDDERQVALDGDRRDAGHGAVAAGGPEDVHLGVPGELAQRPRPPRARAHRSRAPGPRPALLGRRALGSRARVDQEKTPHEGRL